MSNHTTFRTGGPADLLVFPRDMSSVRGILSVVKEEGLPFLAIGGGSNLLVSDAGIRGVVLAVNGCRCAGSVDFLSGGYIRSDAHVLKEDFVRFTADHGFSGVEFMAGIPGCVGGGIAMNAGTNMGCFADFLSEVEYIQPDGLVARIGADTLKSGYREFPLPSGAVITSALFNFIEMDKPELIHERIRRILDERRGKHPLEYPSAGSVFKNPPGQSSWKLIHDAGLKGLSVGGARVSEKHTNFIINTGGATSADIRDLVELVREKVYDMSGITLETEIRFAGSF